MNVKPRVSVQFETALMLPVLQPSSDGFPEGLIAQRFLALGSVTHTDHLARFQRAYNHQR
jgi:hypothetical protein